MLSINPSLTPAQVKTLLQNNARHFPTQPAGSTVPVCQAPSSAVQDECYCTTSTCGAGLLDAGAAVRAAAGNAAPTVSVSASASTVIDGATVTFTGNATAPSGLSIASYSWKISSGSNIASISSAADTASASVLTIGLGSFTVTLMVTDSAGGTASASSSVTVNAPAAPTPGIASSTTVVSAGNSVAFDGSGSTVPSPVTIDRYQWAITSVPATLASFSSATNAATATVTTVGTASGSFTVQLTVTDSLGRQASTSQTVNVTAAAPTASLSASAATVTAGGSLSFDGSGSLAPSGRTISGYQWAITSGGTIAAISGSATTATANVNTSAAGTFTIQLTVTDSASAQNSKSTTVTVNAPALTPPPATSSGGGAFSVGWIALLALASALLLRQGAVSH
jgi:serine protease